MKSYLNIGCGELFHKAWTNIDMVSSSEDVICHDLSKGLPFNENEFQVVYHSHVLEHLSQKVGKLFLEDCFKVLKKGGVLRIVVPNLELIAKNYLHFLEKNLENRTEVGNANYHWTLLELLDQSLRNSSGGEFVNFIKSEAFINKEYVFSRSRDAKIIYENTNSSKPLSFLNKINRFKKKSLSNQFELLSNAFFQLILPKKYKEALKIGLFRQSGEVHYWMYDRYSLPQLLKEIGFSEVKVQTHDTSLIPNWTSFGLDSLEDGSIRKPDSLFVEAVK